MIAIAIGIMAILTGANQYFPSYIAQIGLDPTIGATMASVAMISQIVCNLAFGTLSDKFGAVKVSVGFCIVLVGSFALLFFGGGSVPISLAGAALFGTAGGFYSVGVPIISRAAFGDKYYDKIYSYLSMVMNLIGCFGVAALGLLGGVLGGYGAMFGCCGVAAAVVMLLSGSSVKIAQRIERE